MRKVILVLLLLVGIFLIGTVDVYAQCTYYTCTGMWGCEDGIEGQWTECVDIHVYGDGYSELYSDWFYCELGGTDLGSSNKSFVGTCASSEGLLGATINLRGNSMLINFYEHEYGCFDQLKCTLGCNMPE